MFPIDAAVIPLPSEETTPPVTKTYFDIDPPGGFSNVTGDGGLLNLWFGFWLQDDDLRLVLADRRSLHGELRLGLGCGDAHLLQKAVDRVELQLQARNRVVHRHYIPWL